MRRAAKVDHTQKAIVDALKRCGVSVEVIGKPVDLLVCCRGETSLVEVKSPKDTHRQAGEGFTKEQVEFFARWPGKVHVVRSPDEAIRAVTGIGDLPHSIIPTDIPDEPVLRVTPLEGKAL